MRARIEKRLEKTLRRAAHREQGLVRRVEQARRGGAGIRRALLHVASDGGAGPFDRGGAARMLREAGDGAGVDRIVADFLERTERDEVYELALAIETAGGRRPVVPLLGALQGPSVAHRRGAARAFGWIQPHPGDRAVEALCALVNDPREDPGVREEAAESLSYAGSGRAIPALTAALSDTDPRIRFWAVFALGGVGSRLGRADPLVTAALESMVNDEAAVAGFWTVGQEALGVLGLDGGRWRERLQGAINRVKRDRDALPEDRSWAEFYDSEVR